ncbi:MAG TPA: metallophosphatase domain-containing protein [Acidobacteriota bacterium]
MRIVCLSDTHGYNDRVQVPEGDLLLHAGDHSGRSLREVVKFNAWLASLSHRHKLVIAGNHDFAFAGPEQEQARRALGAAVYLEDSGLEVGGLQVWGSPWQPWFMNMAFNLQRGAAIRAKWDRIPREVDILITHGPPHGVMDRVVRGDRVGCEELKAAVRQRRPRLHLFGHIHEAYGMREEGGVRFVNASICNQRFEPVNRPIVIDL